jgi:hypothetical protein
MGQISQTYLNPGQPEQYQADQKEEELLDGSSFSYIVYRGEGGIKVA